MPGISIIIPAYNAALYIQGCVSSLLCQTFMDIEVIAVNDGSIDATGDILDKNASLDSRLRIIHQDNGGLGKALNTGMDLAKGEYVGFLPMAWRARPNAYGAMYAICKRYGADVVKANYFYLSEGLVRKTIVPAEDAGNSKEVMVLPQENPLLAFNETSFWTSIYKRSLLVENEIRFNQTPGSACQEISFAYKVWCCSKLAWFTEQRLFYSLDMDDNPAFHLASKLDSINSEYDCAIKFASDRNTWLQHQIQKKRYLTLCAAYDTIVRERGGRGKYARALSRAFRKDMAAGAYNANYYGRRERLKYLMAAYLPSVFGMQRRFRDLISK